MSEVRLSVSCDNLSKNRMTDDGRNNYECLFKYRFRHNENE